MTKAQDINERDFLNWVMGTAQRHGWLVKHVPAPMVASGNQWRPYRKAAGLPDLFLLHADPPRMVIAEVKGSGGKLTKLQQEFLQMAKAVADMEDEFQLVRSIAAKRLGVYVFQPGMEQAIEQLLRTRVLT